VTPAAARAVAMMREDRKRDLYEGSGGGDRGSGEYFVTYSDGKGPKLNRAEVEDLLASGLIKPKWRDASLHYYTLSDGADA
jgi:hypothetical protein